MHTSSYSVQDEELIIWNSALGVRDFVMIDIDKIETTPHGKEAWLEEPYDMVGPFSLDELENDGCISFAACMVMSRKQWQEDQVRLRQESYVRRMKAQEKFYEDIHKYNQSRGWQRGASKHFDEKQMRELLKLPVEGILKRSQIKSAFRQIAKECHPDVGGSHEEFILITEARDVLLEIVIE